MRLTVAGWIAIALALFAPACVGAQPTTTHRIGWLSGATAAGNSPEIVDAFRRGMRDYGWIDGRNLTILYRFADGRLDRLDGLAAELVQARVDAIVATTPASLAAARRATSTIPIVMVFGPDPVEAGIVASLAHPGGNVTGLTSLSAELSLKQLQLLGDIVPGLARIGVLWNPDSPWHGISVRRVESVARSLHLAVRAVEVRRPDEFSTAFASMASDHVGAVLCLPDPMTFAHRVELAESAKRQLLPTMNGLAEYAEAGGLASYWPNTAEMFRRAASYVGRILAGANPGDLPVEQPTSFEFVINLKTAKALGVRVPAPVLERADRVIE